MQLQVAFRHMDPSDALRDYLHKKLERVARLAEKIIDVQVTFEQSKLDTSIDLVANLHGHTIKAVERASDPYAAIDLAADKFERQVVKVRERLKDRKHTPTPRQA